MADAPARSYVRRVERHDDARQHRHPQRISAGISARPEGKRAAKGQEPARLMRRRAEPHRAGMNMAARRQRQVVDALQQSGRNLVSRHALQATLPHQRRRHPERHAIERPAYLGEREQAFGNPSDRMPRHRLRDDIGKEISRLGWSECPFAKIAAPAMPSSEMNNVANAVRQSLGNAAGRSSSPSIAAGRINAGRRSISSPTSTPATALARSSWPPGA